ncbi:hypothetical protein QF002_001356 [Paraburkholderia youngii]
MKFIGALCVLTALGPLPFIFLHRTRTRRRVHRVLRIQEECVSLTLADTPVRVEPRARARRISAVPTLDAVFSCE